MDVRDLLVTSIALFVAMDVVGLLPIYLGVTASMTEIERRRIVAEATVTAAGVGLAFLLVGAGVLEVLGVTVGDFQVAGGILLLVLSVHDLLNPAQPHRRLTTSRFGVMPLGTPMIVGPAVMTTLLALARTYGYPATMLAFALNLLVVWAVLRWAWLVARGLGEAGSQAVAKVAHLLLAALGVMLIREGITAALRAQT
jgi:multiple antibiotic resistance protein